MSGGGNGDVLGLGGKRKAILGVGLALVLTLGAVAVIGQVTSYGRLVTALGRANQTLLALTLLGELTAYFGYLVAYRTVAAADGGPRLRHRDAAQVIVLGLGAYVIGSDVGGLSIDFWALREAGLPLHRAARRTLALNTLQAAGLMWLATVAAVVVLAGRPGGAVLVFSLVWLLVPPALTAAAGVLSGERFASRLLEQPSDDVGEGGRSSRRRLDWLRVKLRRGLADAIGGVVFARHVLAHPRRYLGGILGYPLFWLGDFFALWISLQALGYSLSPPRLVVAEATAWVISFVPLPGGGAGFAEATIAYTLHAVGVPLGEALLASLIYRAVNFYLPIVPALALLPRVPRLQESLSRTGWGDRDEDASVHGDEGLAEEEKEDQAA